MKIKIDLLKDIPREIVKIIEKLEKNGFEGYLVGGCVRDMLMNISPKD
jgi:tRNA nucleotidyltransferase/poly(A) polymerase